MSTTTEVIVPSNLSTLVAEMHRLRDAAIAGGWEAIKAAGAVGDALEQVTQADLPGLLDSVGLTPEDATRCAKVSRKLKALVGLPDATEARQLLMDVDVIPAPEPRNPQAPDAPQAIRWLRNVETSITKLTPAERVEAKRLVVAILQRL